MSILEFYLLTIVMPGLGSLGTSVSVVVAIIGVIAIIITAVAMTVEDVPAERIFKPVVVSSLRWIFGVWVVCVLLSVSMPDHRQANLLAGAAVVVNIDGITDLPPNLVKAANAYLEAVTKAQAEPKE